MDNGYDNDVVDMELPGYTEEYAPFADPAKDVSFTANKDEIYRRNELIAAQEIAKERAAEAQARADRIAEYEQMYRDAEVYSPEIQVPSFIEMLHRRKGLIGGIIAIVMISAGALNLFRVYNNSDSIDSARSAAISDVEAALADAANVPADKGIAAGRIKVEPSVFAVGIHDNAGSYGSLSYDLTFLFDLTNTGDEDYSFIEEDMRLTYGKAGTIEPYEVYSADYPLAMSPEGTLTYAALYVVDEEKIYDLKGFSYTKHSKADYAQDDVNVGYVPNFEINISDDVYESILEKVWELTDFEYSAAQEEYNDDGLAEVSEAVQENTAEAVKNIPAPFEKTGGAYVYNTDKLSLRITSSWVLKYANGEPFAYNIILSAEARNLTPDECWLFASNFYFSDGSNRITIRDQEGYDEETTYFTAWQSSGDSGERTRSPMAFGFDGNNYSRFTLSGFIPVDDIKNYSIFGYDNTTGWASAKKDMTSFEGFEIPLEKLVSIG